jgi:hypothetical protein
MAKNDDVLSRFASAGNDAVDLINRVDTATSKFQPGQRKGSIVKSAQGNVFEFPVFISNSIPLDYATATTSLLEQIYAAYLQMAISLNPVIDASSVKNGLQFADFKTNTNKYLEYTDTTYQHDACHAVYQEDGAQFEFNMLSIEDADARLINEAVDHQPLSEFDHFFQEAEVSRNDMLTLYPYPTVTAHGIQVANLPGNHAQNAHIEFNVIDPANVRFGTLAEIAEYLDGQNLTQNQIQTALENMDNTLTYYHIPALSNYEINNNTSRSDAAQMEHVRNVCGSMTIDEFKDQNNTALRQMVNDLDSRNPGFRNSMFATMRAVEQTVDNANRENQRLNAQIDQLNASAASSNASATKTNLDIGNIPNAPTYTDAIAAHRRTEVAKGDTELLDAQKRSALARATVDERNAYKATSPYYRATDAISTGAKTASDVLGAVNAGANAVYNVGTLGTRIQNEKLNNQILKDRVDNLNTDRAIRKTEVNAKAMAKAPQYVDDSKCQKLNTMKPLLMNVTVNMLNKDDSLQPINYIVGVKTHMRVVPSSILPEVARYPLKEMDKLSRKVKWRAGELKLLKDLVFRIDEKKQTAADSRDPNRKWYRRLYELAHMKGDAPASAVVQGKSIFAAFIRDKQGKGKLKNGMIPNASIIMSQQDVDNIKNQTEIDLLKASNARKFCGELFLISLIIVDIDAESIKILLPDQNNDFDVHSLASVQKQLATLDTSGTKTRDMFKLLG